MTEGETKRVELDTDLNRIQANREIGRAFRAVQAVRSFYWALAVVNGVIGFFMFIALNDRGVATHPLSMAIVGIYLALVVVFVVGALRLSKEPLIWALVISLIQTIVAVLRVIDGIGVGSIVSVLLALCCWAAFAAIAPAIRLMKQYPDLRITQRLHGRRAGAPRRGLRA